MRTTHGLRTLSAVATTALVALLAVPAFAGGPLAVCESGTPFVWPDGGTNIIFNPDLGDLGPLGHDQAVAKVDEAFQVWGSILTATLSYAPGAELPVDVDITNFADYLYAAAPDGLSAVVFDDTGEIFDLLYGSGTGILGFAGPEWVNPATCEIMEGLSFLNGPSFDDETAALDVMVHEFGHWTNFAHTVVNGQIYLGSVNGDNTGPTPHDTFGPPPNPFTDIVETMYPFYYGPPIGTATLEADDIAIASTMYPNNFNAGTISGTIFLEGTKISGVNVIARNVADPFEDAVSAISGDFTDDFSQADPVAGTYRINGLTPGADYGVYVDEILAGGFSTPPASPLPGPEELYNGANESSDGSVDDPAEYVAVTPSSVGPVSGIDILFNLFEEGDPLPVGDDGAVLLPLPFTFTICGQDFDAVFVNANGHLTFGAGDPDYTESADEFLAGPPRIAGFWRDFNPTQGGSVYYETTHNSFVATWDNVPQWGLGDSNTFSVELKKGSSAVRLKYAGLDATDGLAGVSCGLFGTSGNEPETDLRRDRKWWKRWKMRLINFRHQTAVYEWFNEGDNDLSDFKVFYNTVKHKLRDAFEHNDSIRAAARIRVPFNTGHNCRYSDIFPAAGDVDYFRFTAGENQTLTAEVTRGQIDSVLGVFDSSGTLIDANDDSNGLLSKVVTPLPGPGVYYLAVTFCCDYDFDGEDPGQGGELDVGRYVLDAEVADTVP